jgi:hypothetical protein
MIRGERIKRICKLTVLFCTALFVVGMVSATEIQSPHMLRAEPSTMPPKTFDEIELHYYGDIANSIGIPTDQEVFWKSAIRLTQDELRPYKSWTLTSVVAAYDAHGQSEMDAKIIIYDSHTPTHPGNIIETQQCYFNSTDFYIIRLNNSIPIIDHDELWIAIEWHQPLHGGDYYAPLDGGPHIDLKGDFCYLNGQWSELYDASGGSIDGNWVIGGIVEGNNPELTIRNVTKAVPGLQAWVGNNGQSAAYNVTWSFAIKGGYFHHINVYASGNISILEPGKSERIYSGPVNGFGRITITITVLADNAPEVTLTKNAFFLGIFVIAIK